MTLEEALPFLVPLIILQLVLIAVGLYDLTRPERRVKNLSPYTPAGISGAPAQALARAAVTSIGSPASQGSLGDEISSVNSSTWTLTVGGVLGW
jgi:hypothetical protein